ncbi:MAG TPA: Na(+)-translocating NADH-quinone reductase subunit C [Thiothrix sp.]|nr:Na(+)-translocating NADH-quinone reductase subunit C [Thiothrix sp.]
MLKRLKKLLALPNDDKRKTLLMALLVSLVCSIFVSIAAVSLKPLQLMNKDLDRKQNILKIAGLIKLDEKPSAEKIEALFQHIEIRLVDLKTGDYVTDIDAATYDQRKVASDPQQNQLIPAEQDIAGIKRRAPYALVYLLKKADKLDRVILPIHGYGLWSTLYGFIALEADANTVVGLGFYEHAETPGLGGEVDNPQWRALWTGKSIYNEQGNVAIRVMKGHVDANSPQAAYQVDGLSGATLTSRGVENMLHYWLSEQGFAAYLAKVRAEQSKVVANPVEPVSPVPQESANKTAPIAQPTTQSTSPVVPKTETLVAPNPVAEPPMPITQPVLMPTPLQQTQPQTQKAAPIVTPPEPVQEPSSPDLPQAPHPPQQPVVPQGGQL